MRVNKFLTKNSLRVYKTLLKMYKKNRQYPIHTDCKQIAREIGLSQLSVLMHLNTLHQFGFIKRIQQNPRFLGSLIYILKFPLR